MREFNLDLLIGKKIAVNCKTKKEETEFLDYLNKVGIKWCSEKDIFDNKEYHFEQYREKTCFCLVDKKGLTYSDLIFFIDEEYKILYLDDLAKEDKNNFKEYGFEADFEGEIYTSYKSNNNQIFYNGAIWFKPKHYYHYMKPVSWTEKGEVIHHYFMEDYLTKYRLKPIKKEWYENPDNFPCVIISFKTNKPHIAYNYNHLEEKIKQEQFSSNPDKFRPATKEEVLSLLVKD